MNVTGLQLMNRVLAFRRQPQASSYSSADPEHVVTLNALNMAKEDILSTRRWEFDLRHDGQLVTMPTAVSRGYEMTFSYDPVSPGIATFTESLSGDGAAVQFVDDTIMRVVPTGSASFSETAFRVNSYAFPTTDVALLNLSVSPSEVITGACDLIYAEYLLPNTVREVVRASFDQDELSLKQLDPTVEFDECIPSPHLDSGRPSVFSVGGFDRATYLSSGAVPNPKLRAVVWPVPDDPYVISYSYYYRHEDLTDGDSTWAGIPSDVINDIVWQATAIVKMAVDGDYGAAHFSDMAQSQASVKYSAYSGSSGRRHTVRSWDSGGDGLYPLREGFPNKVIG